MNASGSFKQVPRTHSESEDRIKILQEENKRLLVENEYQAKELAFRANEISRLKESLALLSLCHSSSFDTVANARVGTLEQKLKYVTSELEKEISNSTQLAIDKIKLQSCIQRMEMQANVSTKLNSVDPSIVERSERKPVNLNIPPTENPKNLNMPPVTTPSMVMQRQKQDRKKKLNEPPVTTAPQVMQQHKLDTSSVLLENFPLKDNGGSLEETVISIAATMRVIINKDDIINIKLLNGGARKTPNNASKVYVQFKTDEIKLNFLSNRATLKKDKTFAKVSIKEFIDAKVHALFLYANKKLSSTVFGHVVCMNNTVIAKKYRDDNNFITISSKNQVDDLLRSHLLANRDKPSVYLGQDKFDECYYKI